MSEPDAVTFDAAVYKVQTLVDGGIRLTLDMPETAIEAASKLMDYQRLGRPLHVAVVVNHGKRKRNRKAEATA